MKTLFAICPRRRYIKTLLGFCTQQGEKEGMVWTVWYGMVCYGQYGMVWYSMVREYENENHKPLLALGLLGSCDRGSRGGGTGTSLRSSCHHHQQQLSSTTSQTQNSPFL